jgi:hypothetical protein
VLAVGARIVFQAVQLDKVGVKRLRCIITNKRTEFFSRRKLLPRIRLNDHDDHSDGFFSGSFKPSPRKPDN